MMCWGVILRVEVRQKLYQSSIGSWRKYRIQLEPVAAMMRNYLRHLKATGALAFNKNVNWDLKPDHKDYTPSKREIDVHPNGM